MIFTVTYRGTDGAVKECRMEAESREDCFTQCRKNNIVTMNVREENSVSRRGRGERRDARGKDGRAAAFAKATAAEGRVRGRGKGGSRVDRAERKVVACVLYASLFASICGGLWWCMHGETLPQENEKDKKSGLIKEVTPAKAPKPVVEKPVVTNEVPNVKTNGWVLRRGPHGKMTLRPPGPDQNVHHPSTLDEYWPKSIFLTTQETKLAGLLRMRPGARIIANRFLPGEEEAWLRVVKTPIRYEETDTPEDRQLREDVQAIKEEILKQVESGKTIKEVMEAEYDRLNEQAAYREKLAQTLYLLKKEGTQEEVDEYLKTVNPMLREQGMLPLSGSKAPPKGRKAEYFRKKAEAAQAEAAKE